DRVGRTVPVYVYTNGDSAELFLNGKSLGLRSKKTKVEKSEVDKNYYEVIDRYRLRWEDVIYEPGTLTAVAYKNGKKIGETSMSTAGDPAQIKLTPDRTTIKADGYDLSYILVDIVDKDGTLCPLADNIINFMIEGPAEISAVGNGNPLSLEPFQANSRKLFYGKAMLILRSIEKQSGEVSITAHAEGLKMGQTRIHIEP
ncbi:MAG TPA: DUF4982 domain-containing protein, partial [Anaerolineae bacterium]|nr:DUF4982 domain-containing protein [Anaerolineae bacterium]